MTTTRYRPPPEWLERIAPTEDNPWRGRVVRGQVHDESTVVLGEVAAHAGLFSTTGDLGGFLQMLLNGGSMKGERLLRAGTIARSRTGRGSSRAAAGRSARLGHPVPDLVGRPLVGGRPFLGVVLPTHRLHRHLDLGGSGTRTLCGPAHEPHLSDAVIAALVEER